jgi:hypothetical protein
MPEMQEVFRMATQKVRPDPGFVDRQYENQRRQSRRRKAGALALVAVLVVVGVVVGISTLRSGDEGKSIPGSAPKPTATPIPSSLHSGVLEPGTYVIKALDTDFDAKYRITMDVPDGYEGFPDGSGVAKLGRIGQMAVGAWVIGDVYADPCRWETTLLDPPPGSSVDALVAALADRHHGRRLRRYVHGADRARRNQARRLRRCSLPTMARHRRGGKVSRARSARHAVDHRRRRRSTTDRCLARGGRDIGAGPSRAHPDRGVRPDRTSMRGDE